MRNCLGIDGRKGDDAIVSHGRGWCKQWTEVEECLHLW